MTTRRERATYDYEGLVLGAGGTYGILCLGALGVFENAGVLHAVKKYAGSSVGAILAAGLAIGHTCRDLEDKVLRHGPAFKLNVDIDTLTATYGLDDGTSLRAFVQAVTGLHHETFRDIRDHHGRDLTVCVTNVNKGVSEYWGPDTHPDADVLTTVCASCSVPLLFAAVHLGRYLYVDGAVADGFPCTAMGATKSLGVCYKKRDNRITNLETFVCSLLGCTVASTANVTVFSMDPGGRVPVAWGLPETDIRAMLDEGRAQALHFLDLHAKKTM